MKKRKNYFPKLVLWWAHKASGSETDAGGLGTEAHGGWCTRGGNEESENAHLIIVVSG